jgi:arylsulfatase A-like enzyme
MQDCFRLHPDVYGSQLDEDELDEQVSKQAGETEADIPAERIEKKDEEPAQENKPLPDPRAVQHEAERELDTPKTLRAPQPWHDASEKNGEAEKETKK